MTDHPPGPDAPESPPSSAAPPSAPPAARRRGLLVWLILLGLLAAAAYWALREYGEHWRAPPAEAGVAAPPPWQAALEAALEAAEARAAATRAELAQLRERQRQLEQRLSDLAAGNKVLREELFGIAERAAMVEDALTRQAQARREGARALRLEEIEFLLQLANERLQLFGDPDSAERALQLALDSLEQLRDPVYAGVRATLAQELAMLRAMPADPRRELRGTLDALQRVLPTLPQQGTASTELADGEPSRLRELLGGLVTVRRVDTDGALLGPVERAARLSALQLQLTLARAALEQGDAASWNSALERALDLFDGLFDGDAAPVAGAQAELQRLHAASPRVEMPALGAALRELRNLRATRRLGEEARAATAAPAAAPTPSEPEAVEIERE